MDFLIFKNIHPDVFSTCRYAVYISIPRGDRFCFTIYSRLAMKLITRLPALIGLLCAILPVASSQELVTQFTPTNVVVAADSTFRLTLGVRGFTRIGTFQLPVKFDKSLVQLVGVRDYANLPAFDAANHSTIAIANQFGRVTFSWQADPQMNANGSTLADDAPLFTLVFKGKQAGSTTINIANVGSGVEVSRAPSLSPVTVVYANGGALVTVTGTGSGSPNGFSIRANTICIPAGRRACMPVTVKEFNKIISLQFALEWDPSKLRFDTVQKLNLPGWDPVDFWVDPGKGLLKTVWGTLNGQSVSRPDDARLFEACFTTITPDSTVSMVGINSDGSYLTEIINESGIDVATAGFGVSDTVYLNHCPPSVSATGESPAQLPLSLGPNPFSTDAYIIFETTEAAPVRLSVADPTGRLVYERAEHLPAGQHRLTLAASDLHGPGLYFIHLQAGARRAVRKVILIP